MANRRRSNRMFARGINRRLAKKWSRRNFNGIGTRGWLDRSGIRVLSQTPTGTQPTFAIVVSGANTPLSVGVAGSAVTLNAATNGSSAATTTAKQAVDALRASPAATAVLWSWVEEHADPATVVSAAGPASLVATQT